MRQLEWPAIRLAAPTDAGSFAAAAATTWWACDDPPPPKYGPITMQGVPLNSNDPPPTGGVKHVTVNPDMQPRVSKAAPQPKTESWWDQLWNPKPKPPPATVTPPTVTPTSQPAR